MVSLLYNVQFYVVIVRHKNNDFTFVSLLLVVTMHSTSLHHCVRQTTYCLGSTNSKFFQKNTVTFLHTKLYMTKSIFSCRAYVFHELAINSIKISQCAKECAGCALHKRKILGIL